MSTVDSYYKNTRPEVCVFLPDSYSKVLEIGCAEGEFRHNLDKHCEYWGVEPSPRAAKTATKFLHKVLIGTYDEIAEHLPDHYFDLIICNDVIEHMVDHNIFFQQIKTKLHPNGYITGSIPNVRYINNLIEVLLEKDWRYKEQGILDKTHLRFFTEKSLKRSIEENGFTIEKLEGINNYLKNLFSLDGVYRRIKYFPMIFILGQDIKYMQFGIRIRLTKTPNA